ncbi:acyl-CoA dehydrogenase family protein [Gulosibacter sp. ACHW.36C]|uniref:Acyl-[acyl-carrier-protein] dehydrogenase MbtN n=1 Tax=Gulosibacter sediminis TaxID=1729695 RepID=A0ABY4N270_9MICO|nr:acyl-CoA dehydrogenase family protein [Gulosibacter sediminis]UQN15608.1 acyl-CoA dehydrogenase family protein [Gulosibacter sediminis]
MRSTFYDDDHQEFRELVRDFIAREITPNYARWEADGGLPLELYPKMGETGLVGLAIPEQYGGMGLDDYRFRMVINEELSRAQAPSVNAAFGVHDDIVIAYLLDLATDEQRERWLPGMADGTRLSAVAMTEPGAGSDLQGIRTHAERDGDDWVLNGSKTFITNGVNASLVLVFARTDPDAGSHGYSLFVVENGMPGFEHGRKLDKVGLHSQDTAELFFSDVRVPAANLLGEAGQGLIYLLERLPRERISIGAAALASAETAYDWGREYVFNRSAFGQTIGDLATVRFTLAELETEIDITRAYVERCILALNDGELTTVEASKAKWWATELEQRVITRSLQLHGGYGFMEEYPIARAFRDSRVQSIYGGTTEIMKEIIGRDIAKRSR